MMQMNKKESNIQISTSSNIEKQGEVYKSKVQMKQMELGWFGKIFGSAEHAPTNIGGITVILLIITGIFFSIAGKGPGEFWTLMMPVISGIVMYLLGKGR
jgi:hypothetical protein